MTDFQLSLLLFGIAAVVVNVVTYGGIMAVYFGEKKRAADAAPARVTRLAPPVAELSAAHALEQWRSLRKAA